jgi:hypothetical protein
LNPTERKGVREFGIVFAVVGALYAGWSLWRGRPTRALVGGGVGALFLLGSFAAPALMRPLWRAWMAFAHVLGWINTRIILGALFYLVFTPLGLVLRLFGRDPMARRRDPAQASYWEPCDVAGAQPERLRRLF